VSVSIGNKFLFTVILLSFLALALYFPYWWFGVIPFSANNTVSQEKIEQFLAGKNIPDYYAEPLVDISDEQYAAQKESFTWCRFCHTLEKGGENRVGPNLHRILGKPAAVLEGFAYSQAFIDARDNGLIWTPETFAAFIAEPHEVVPGNRMRYPPRIGYEDSPERRQRIYEYLLRETR